MASRHSALYERQRQLMVECDIARRGIHDERVLMAMRQVPREEFVPRSFAEKAYENAPQSIGYGQTISQPYTVAFMCEALRVKPTDRVLEIGAGSGYGAAVLSLLAASVTTIERIPELAASTQERLTRLGYDNVDVVVADGTHGCFAAGPFDGIIVTAGAEHLPDEYAKQLREGGRIVIPIGETPRRQTMFRFTRRGQRLHSENLGEFAFVPLIGDEGWTEDDF